ncbi:MAG: recombination regulator RecX [Betaproteobacteria bacterium HGW-Betaproteobacteria-11]|nr:MAG: recombination regulator RecX [Betaproteobacteria bacterium HGW-Betaproteobacteria-11]
MNALRSRALRLLARRDYSRAELARKLAAHGSAEEIEIVIAEFAASQLQSDQRCVESYLRTHGGRLGVSRLRQSLARRGLDSALIEAQLSAQTAGGELADEPARARSVWARKFAAPPADAREWARQARFLQGRGFAAEIIRHLMKSLPASVDPGEDDSR